MSERLLISLLVITVAGGALLSIVRRSARAPDVSVPGGDPTVSVVGGDGQAGLPGRPLEQPIEIRVVDGVGRPIVQSAVRFSVREGGGSVSREMVLTDLDGVASVDWSLGTELRSAQVVTASFLRPGEGAPISVEARARFDPGEVAALLPLGPRTVFGDAGAGLDTELEIRAVDERGVGVPGVDVDWDVVEGVGRFETDGIPTDSMGVARARWIAVPWAESRQYARASAGPVAAEYRAILLAADTILFRDQLSEGLGQWWRSYHPQGRIVPDPRDPMNEVLTFEPSTEPRALVSRVLRLERRRRYVLTFDYLGKPVDAGTTVPDATVGASDRNLERATLWASVRDGEAPVTLVRDGRWHGYEWEFAERDARRSVREMHFWLAVTGVGGMDYFDNVTVRLLN